MKETIIFAPGLNGNELQRSLALHGINSIGMRICGAAKLARLALMRSGISITEDFVSAREGTAIVAEAVKGVPYFEKATYSDIIQISAALRRMRGLVADREEEPVIREKLLRGIFPEKNKALLNVYQNYMELLAQRNSMDAVSLIRRATFESRELAAEFLILEEYPLNPLEKELLEHVSGGRFSATNLQNLFGITEKPLHIDSMKNCYGASNEVETILADIYSKKSLDQCTVAVTDALTYGQLFFDYALLYDIPITFGCGIPVMNSNPARLLSLYYNWMTGGFYGPDAIRTILSSKAFNRAKLFEQFPEKEEGFSWSTFYSLLENLRLTNDAAVNEKRIRELKRAVDEEADRIRNEDSKSAKEIRKKQGCIPCLEIVGQELSLPAEEFITKYSYIRKGSDSHAGRLLMMLDLSAVKVIYDELKVIRMAGIRQSADEIIPNVLAMTVCAQRSEAGKLHVTGIDGAFGSLRQNLYIVGMSAPKFPGSPKENYLLLDADLRLFGPEAEPYTSDGKILRKREKLLSLVNLASAMESHISVSYTGLNVSELKKENASSMIFELFRKARGQEATSKELEDFITKVEYFEPAVSASRLVGEAYVKGENVKLLSKDEQEEGMPAGWEPDRSYSPTALDTFFGCPRAFMLRYLLGIPEPKEYDPFEIISALERGTLAHSMMEALNGSDFDLDGFLRYCENAFDQFLAEHPPLILEHIAAAKEDFLEMMETAFEMDPHREVVLEEEDIECMHETGIRIHGYPDRVEKLDDGTCLIVDFKSGRSVTHVEDDIGTCLQVVVYAYLMEQEGFSVSGGEYRYLRLGETVSCRYDEDMKRQLSERLDQFKHYMQVGYFPVAETPEEGKDPCKYCKYETICGKIDAERDGE